MKDKNPATSIETVAKKTVLQRIFQIKIILLMLIISSSALTFFAKTYPYFPIDIAVTKTVQQLNQSWFRDLMEVLTLSGNTNSVAVLVAVCCVALVFFKKINEAYIIFFSTFGAYLISWLVKNIVSRPRPDPSLIIQIGEFNHPDSFPSGHVLFAIGFYGMILLLAYTELKKGILRNVIIVFCILVIILMGLSRIYLGAHWFSDTLGSYLLGTIWLYLMSHLFKKMKVG